MNKIVAVSIACTLLVAGSSGVGLAEQKTPGPFITLTAADILPENTLQGANYTIDSTVYNDGLINTYDLTTNYGPTTVESTTQLMIRLNELKALEAMEEVDRKGIFGDALVSGVKAPVQAVVDLVQEPVETSKNIVKGAGRFLSNIGNAIVSDDPNHDNALKVALGYDVAKRQFAFEFGINPYTSYEPVVNRLGEISRAAVAGGLTPKAVLAAINTDLTTALRISGTAKGLKELVRDKAPTELIKINAEKMLKMGVSADLTNAFLSNYIFDPQEATLLVGELATMEGVEGRDLFFAVANTATERMVAVYYRYMAEMVAGYHANINPVARIINIDGTLHVQSKNGAVALIAPLDYIFLTMKVDGKLDRLDKGIAQINATAKELWITGEVDSDAMKELTGRGWKVMPKSTNDLIK